MMAPETNCTKKLAVVADIHGNIPALEAVIADMAGRGVVDVVNLGDILSGPLWPTECARFLMNRNWINISGNHDRLMTHASRNSLGPSDAFACKTLGEAEIEWLRSLPSVGKVFDISLFHGTPTDDSVYLLETVERGRVRLATQAEIRLRLRADKTPILLCGHTHVPRMVTLVGSDEKGKPEQLIVNPGSVGLQAYDDTLPEPHVVETGSPHARYAILENDGDGWKVSFIAVPYDFTVAAKQARKNGRPDWENALRTGYFSYT